ncbi:MAG: hypothetical protein JRI68_34690, partial [Deltaproteobacteria bacterium]|nr:hypothetical protein [Deltaproteobacteria bacterium]
MPQRAFFYGLVAAALLWAPLALAQPDDDGEPEPATAEGADADEGDEGDEGEGDEGDEGEAPPEPAPEPASDGDDHELGSETAAAAATPEAGEERGAAKVEAEEADEFPRLDLGGHIRGGFGFRIRPEALPRDELDYGFFGVGGIAIDAWPFEMWRAKLHLEFNPSAIETSTDLGLFALEYDGEVDGLSWVTRRHDGLSIQEATAAFIPSEMFQIKAGITRIPFSLQQQSKNTELMLSKRSPPNEKFLRGGDIGAIARGDFGDGLVRVSLGVFNGGSLGLRVADAVARGVVFA